MSGCMEEGEIHVYGPRSNVVVVGEKIRKKGWKGKEGGEKLHLLPNT
jgi:hypothetical protein